MCAIYTLFVRHSPLVICKSHYSFLKGVHSVPDLVTFASDHGLRQLCLADENGLYGAIEFATACGKANITPLIGAELTDGKRNVTVIARNRNGYARLSEIITQLQLHEPPLTEIVVPGGDDLLHFCADPVLLQRWVRRGETGGLYAIPVVSDSSRCRSLLTLVSRRPDLAPSLSAVPVIELNLFSGEDIALYKVLRAISRNCTVASLPTEETIPKAPSAKLFGQLMEEPLLPFQTVLSSGDVARLCTFRFDFTTLHLPRYIHRGT